MNNPCEIFQRDDRVQLVAELARQFQAPAYLVGGSLRDAILGRPVHDFDFVLDGAVEELPSALARRCGGSFFWLDRQRCQSRVVIGNGEEAFTLDFAPLRGRTIREDLLLRDFTINALAMAVTGNAAPLIDPLGGLDDLAAKSIRACGPNAFDDDPLRLLRAVRFAVTLGFVIEPTTWAAICCNSLLLNGVAGERIRDEFFQILPVPGVGNSLRQLLSGGLLPQIVGETVIGAGTEGRISRADVLERLLGKGADLFGEQWPMLAAHLTKPVEGDIPLASLVTLAAFLSGEAAQSGIVAVTERLRLGTKARRELLLLCGCLAAVSGFPDITAGDRVLFRFFRDQHPAGPELVLLPLAAGMLAPELASRLVSYYYLQYRVQDEDLLLTGAQVMALLAISPGPEVGSELEVLRRAERSGLVASVAEAREFLLKNRLTKAKPMG
jgi:poly(A) polymerase